MTWRGVARALLLTVQVATLVAALRAEDEALAWRLMAVNIACCLMVIVL